jgi:hypothetical protein
MTTAFPLKRVNRLILGVGEPVVDENAISTFVGASFSRGRVSWMT